MHHPFHNADNAIRFRTFRKPGRKTGPPSVSRHLFALTMAFCILRDLGLSCKALHFMALQLQGLNRLLCAAWCATCSCHVCIIALKGTWPLEGVAAAQMSDSLGRRSWRLEFMLDVAPSSTDATPGKALPPVIAIREAPDGVKTCGPERVSCASR